MKCIELLDAPPFLHLTIVTNIMFGSYQLISCFLLWRYSAISLVFLLCYYCEPLYYTLLCIMSWNKVFLFYYVGYYVNIYGLNLWYTHQTLLYYYAVMPPCLHVSYKGPNLAPIYFQVSGMEVHSFGLI